MPGPLVLQTPRDMLDKAKFELRQMKAEQNAYTLFNFFVTCYHIIDYVKQDGKVPAAAISMIYKDRDFLTCNFICNKGKHLVLHPPKDKPMVSHEVCSGVIGGSPIASGPIAGGPELLLSCDGKEVRPVELAERLVAMWDGVFAKYGIP